ncbi:MAG: TetR family transcriptional regulator [Lachnospiraceae bacterium]|nr:TetR family transcriptional regulator [Lachnospiraceae bacterium]
MPTERFYRLPEAKKQLIREAAIREFARVPFEKASINQIIHNAEISRGSFYTYFEDKQDVVKFIFEDTGKQMLELCGVNLDENGGDLMDMFSHLFEHSLSQMEKTTTMVEVVRNVFSYEQNAQIFGLDDGPQCGAAAMDNEEFPLRWIYDRIDKSRLRKASRESFISVMTLGLTAVLLAIKQYYRHPEQVDAVRNVFHGMLDTLRYGAYAD